jgi:CDP-diacylglycerol--serine O-phosphatidyltransferase
MPIIGKIKEKRSGKERRLRYVQALPTLCTLGNLLCGFGVIHLCMRSALFAGALENPASNATLDSAALERMMPSNLVIAAYLIFMSMVFDALDGRLARWTRHTTDFGAQLDSLADMVSFGTAPAVLIIAMMNRQLHTNLAAAPAPFSESLLGRLTWIMAAVFVACAALRLARFNVEQESVEQAHHKFRGLPSPGAAGAMACLVILHDHVFFYDRSTARLIHDQGTMISDLILWSMPPFALVLGLLMVSRWPYTHVANTYLRRRWDIGDIVKFLVIAALVVLYPEIMLSVMVVGYAVTGPMIGAWRRSRRDAGDETPLEDIPVDSPNDDQDAVG